MHLTSLSNKTFVESDIKQSTDRTWAYHIVMDVVQKIQRDHAIPIPVIV